jgi:predicted nucleic acid-binding protein
VSHLLDTCVLIDYLRDREAAVSIVHGMEARPSVSVVTVAELCAGVRNESEHQRIAALPDLLHVWDVGFEIARLAGHHCLRYRGSHGVGIPDALIAATAQVHGARLVTRNARHFPMLDDLLVPYQ